MANKDEYNKKYKNQVGMNLILLLLLQKTVTSKMTLYRWIKTELVVEIKSWFVCHRPTDQQAYDRVWNQPDALIGPSVRTGKKKNRNALSPNAEGVRRGAVGAEDQAPNARGVSMQLGGLGERCISSPNRVRAEPGRQTPFGAFWSENALSTEPCATRVVQGSMLYLANPSMQT